MKVDVMSFPFAGHATLYIFDGAEVMYFTVFHLYLYIYILTFIEI